ncbi:MAG: aminoacyl-tRNA hydrolase [Gammaproteobacteria bacterium]|nr:MAG: aminoacyl-tRNA hydrolase [Gammaproteobacteria bacterium]
MTSTDIKIIVGLGNPGSKYEPTRHNVGFWTVEQLADSCGESFSMEARFNAELSRVFLCGKDIRLIKPQTFMNNSGQAIGEVSRYFRVEPEQILVVHDELDIAPGTAKLKKGGGHGGHNGLRDAVAHLNSKDFLRLRIGIGHPGNSKQVTGYVLGNPSKEEYAEIHKSISDSIEAIKIAIEQGLEKAMHWLHSR